MPSESSLTGEVFFPPVELRRGKSEINKVLYSANMSSHFGRGTRFQLYFDHTMACKISMPNAIKVMLYRSGQAGESPGRVVFELYYYKSFIANSHRYRYCQESVVSDVYFPINMIGRDAPQELFYGDYLRRSGVRDKLMVEGSY